MDLFRMMITPVHAGAEIKRNEELVLSKGTPVIAEIIHQDNGVFCMPVGGNVGSWICASKLFRLTSPEALIASCSTGGDI